MQKVIYIIGFSLSINLAFSQLKIPTDSASGKVSYTEIVYADSASKKELFGRAIEWVALNYKSANDVIQLKDDERGKLIAKGFFKKTLFGGLLTAREVSVYHTLIMDFKEGRCKIQLTNFSYKYYNESVSASGIYIPGGWVEGTLESQIQYIQNKKNMPLKSEWIDFLKECDKEVHMTLDTFSDYLQKPITRKLDDW